LVDLIVAQKSNWKERRDMSTDDQAKRYVVLTRFSYAEPGHSRNWLLNFEVVCLAAELPARYAEWIKTLVADDDSNERHYGSRQVVGAYEATSISVGPLTVASRQAVSDLLAEEEAADLAQQARDEADRAQWVADTEKRERAEFDRLKEKLFPAG
jgi:hypothetical protein